MRSSRVIFFTIVFLAVFGAGAFAQVSDEWPVRIEKSGVTQTATFYQYVTKSGMLMEVFAVRATDGTIRTALNTCQVCYGSGRGYYVQQGRNLVCQNCGNRFDIDQVGKVKGGCNPIPILGKDRLDSGDAIGISGKFLATMSPYFAKWKKR